MLLCHLKYVLYNWENLTERDVRCGKNFKRIHLIQPPPDRFSVCEMTRPN